MGRWYVGQKDNDGRLTGLGFDNLEEAYQECESLNRGWSSFRGAQDNVGKNPYKVYDCGEETEDETAERESD